MKTLLVNLYGAPCSGKSVKMMQLAVVGKLRRVFCEISPEVAKEYIVRKIEITREVQLELTAEQARRTMCFVGNVQVAVTDAPILIGAFYAWYRKMDNLGEIDRDFRELSRRVNAKAAKVVNVYTWRDHAYDEAGRIESESEDETIAREMWAYVKQRCEGETLIEARSTELPEVIWDRIMAAAGK